MSRDANSGAVWVLLRTFLCRSRHVGCQRSGADRQNGLIQSPVVVIAAATKRTPCLSRLLPSLARLSLCLLHIFVHLRLHNLLLPAPATCIPLSMSACMYGCFLASLLSLIISAWTNVLLHFVYLSPSLPVCVCVDLCGRLSVYLSALQSICLPLLGKPLQ